jgi:hypothetical protein
VILPTHVPVTNGDCPWPVDRDPDHFSDVYQAALCYAYIGLRVFPVGTEKEPLCRWGKWRYRVQTDADITRMFFGRDLTPRPDVRGVAAILGTPSGGLGLRDFDTAEAYRSWAAERPPLAAALPTTRTHRGYHVLHRTTDPERFVKLFDAAGRTDGDYRSDGGHYAVLPPSRHPAGADYRWFGRQPWKLADVPTVSLAATGFLAEHRIPAQPESEEGPEEGAKRKNALCATSAPQGTLWELPEPIREAVLRSQPHREGERNARLTDLARRLKDISPGVPADYWRSAFTAWWSLARDTVRTKEWGASWDEFCRKWVEVVTPMSASLPRSAMADAVKRQNGTSPDDRIVAACRAAATLTGGPFWMAGRTAADAAGVAHRTAARRLTKLSAPGGPLVLLARGRPSRTKRVASLYRLASASPTSALTPDKST